MMSSPQPLNKLTQWRRDVELIYCGETGRADLHKMNAKLSPKDRACTSYKRSNLPAYAHSWTVFLLQCKRKQEITKQYEPVNTFMDFLTLLGFGLIVYI